MPLGKLLPHCGLLLDLLPMRGWKRPYSTQKWSSKGHWARHQQRWIHTLWKQGWPRTGEEHQREDWGSSYVTQATGNSLHPWTHSILLPSRIHVSFCISTVLWIALSRRTWRERQCLCGVWSLGDQKAPISAPLEPQATSWGQGNKQGDRGACEPPVVLAVLAEAIHMRRKPSCFQAQRSLQMTAATWAETMSRNPAGSRLA